MNTQEIPKTYDPKDWEDRLYAEWEASGLFNPDVCIEKGFTKADAKPFSIVLPPPNVTGRLHAGHAAMLAIEDAIVRFKRMQGYRTLWVPGTDHAAIATQSKVEGIIKKEEGKTRHDFTRDDFLKRVEAFALESHDTIITQTKKLGSSLDWSREAYTLDEKRSLAVQTAFQKMYADGLIYRGDRIVNWDPELKTTVSDDELEWKEERIPLYYFQYGPFVISTARPETKFGDKYVVMHPDDERYKEYTHGQQIEVEWINGKVTATIIKDEAIDPAFGTGVMTITPWHSTVDFEIAERHDLDREQIIDEHGKLLPIAQEFSGLPIREARKKIVEKLEKKNLLVKIEENYLHNIAINSRGGGVIEPQIKKQWFIAVNKEFDRNGKKETLKSLMLRAVQSKETTILPERFERTYFHWINNLRDWCISRQIWYGHRIPVWYCLSCKKERVNATVKSRWFFVRHGESEWNEKGLNAGTTDIPLNKTGREQARVAGEKLSGENIEVIFSSNLSRAHETAQIIGNTIGVKEIITDERLQERSMGKAEGIPYHQVNELYPEMRTYQGKSADNESYEEVEKRIWDAVSEHLEKHAHKNVLIASHGATLRALWRRIRNIDPDSIMEIRKFENAEPLSVDILEPCEHCGHHFFEQDSDTLDTWFSSGLWTFSTLGWPDKNAQDFKNYHPTTLLETGYDILFFWVARMILMSAYILDEIPFRTVYLHGLVRDEQGRKMSKSLGNIIDPLDVIHTYGADALRLSLVIGSTPGNDIKLGDEKIESYRNFTNKLWNIGRYIINQQPINNSQREIETPQAKSDADHWILSRLEQTTKEVTRLLENYQLSLAGEKLRDFTWNELADWYVEIHKIEKNDSLLQSVFKTTLTLWHPFMPFVTEALWKNFSTKNTPLLIETWPEKSGQTFDTARADRFKKSIALIQEIRAIKSLYHIDPAAKLNLSVQKDSESSFRENEALFRRLARIELFHYQDILPSHTVLAQSGDLRAYIELDGIIDFDAEKKRLERERQEKEKYISSIEAKLSNKNFIERAKPEIVELERTKLEETKKQLTDIASHLASLL